MSVLAGARELVFFNLGDVMQGHPDHAKLVNQFDRLADLADFVRTHPVVGVPAYKPPNSDPGGDMYLMDFLGMLGIPLVPVHEFPESAPVMFLPAQAAADPNLLPRVKTALDRDASVIVTASLLIASPQGGELARMVGVDPNIISRPASGQLVSDDGNTAGGETKVDIESPIESREGPGDLVCEVDGKDMLLLRTRKAGKGRISLLNTHTYSQADFDAVGEVLLCPRPLGILSMEGTSLVQLRSLFSDGSPFRSTSSTHARGLRTALFGPSCVTLHQFSTTGGPDFVVQNFNDTEVTVSVAIPHEEETHARFIDRFSGQEIPLLHDSRASSPVLNLSIPARGRLGVPT